MNGYMDAPEDIYLLASVYQNQGQSGEAAELLEEALASGEMEPLARNIKLLSQAWRGAGDWARIKGHLERHFALATPVDTELVRQLVALQLQAGSRCDALVSLSWLLAHAPDGKGTVWVQMGVIYAELGDTDLARTAFIQARNYPEVANIAERAQKTLGQPAFVPAAIEALEH